MEKKLNRFSGFGHRMKTAEAVGASSPASFTPLKWGDNENMVAFCVPRQSALDAAPSPLEFR